MALGFNTMNNIQAYGDGNGNVVIEEWRTDNYEETDLVGRVSISLDRFEAISNNVKEFAKEAWGGIEIDESPSVE